MIIKSITLKNFRQYRGEQTIDFSTDKEKNVTVVVGVNTSGKTTLVQAFIWCLYGPQCVSFKTKDVLNSQLAASLVPNSTVDAGVKIVLVHEGKEYTISRYQRYSKNDFGVVRPELPSSSVSYKDEIGNAQCISDTERINTINKILPQGLSDYFFFDGERIEEINDKNNVVAAVRGLMGLDIVSSAVDHLDPNKASSVVGKLKRELDVGSDQRSLSLKRNLEKAQADLTAYETRLENVEKEIIYWDDQKKKLDALLAGTETVREKQKEKAMCERSCANAEIAVQSMEDTLIRDFNREYATFFLVPLIKRAQQVVNSSSRDMKGIPEMHATSIDYILKRGRCICGCDLTKNQGAVENIQYEQGLLPPKHIGSMVRSFNDTSTDKLSRCSDIAPMIEKDYINIRRNVINKEEYEKELKEISAEIQKMGEVNTAQIERDSNQAREMSRKKIQEKGSLLAQITNTKNNIASLSKEIEGLALKNEKNTLLRREIAYAEAIYEWFKTTYDVEEKEVKEKLSDSINRIFNQMYHGTRQVTIDDKYKVKLLTRVGDKNISTDESKGLEAVKNFAFISGLVDLARNKANDQGTPFSAEKNNLYVTEPYPIVMDAPFSNVDEIHISNIATILPNIAEQVILIVMKKDWEYAKQTMQDKVGAMYMISKVDNSDTYSKVEVSDNV